MADTVSVSAPRQPSQLAIEVLGVLLEQLGRGGPNVEQWEGPLGTTYIQVWVEGKKLLGTVDLDLSVIGDRAFFQLVPMIGD